jgi:hypothetical protein
VSAPKTPEARASALAKRRATKRCRSIQELREEAEALVRHIRHSQYALGRDDLKPVASLVSTLLMVMRKEPALNERRSQAFHCLHTLACDLAFGAHQDLFELHLAHLETAARWGVRFTDSPAHPENVIDFAAERAKRRG